MVGPTGCGKTTFLNCLTKIYQPSEGEIYIDNEPANPQKHNISFVFQEPSAFPWLTVRENLEFGLGVKRVDKAEIKRRVDKIVDLMQPDLLLMDEPYGQMDIKMRFYLEDEVIKLWKELGSTVIFITHNIEEAVYLADRVLILSNKPTTVKESLKIDLPHPRDITDPKFIEYRNYVTDAIKWW